MLCILALVLSATGLFAITGIVYESRTKEIGIRKVNGASFQSVMRWLLRDIILVVIVSMAIAIPISYYPASRWLDHYVNKISPESWMFVFGGIILLFFALLTVGWQTWRASARNPIEALRYE